jgi:hypothetical protein
MARWLTISLMGGSHIGTGGDRYLLANRPSEGSRATRQAWTTRSATTSAITFACTSTTRAWFPTSWSTTIHRAHIWSQEFIGARRQIGERAAPLHTRPRRHPGARPADPRALRPDGAVRAQHRDPEPHCRLAPSCCSTTAGNGRPSRSRRWAAQVTTFLQGY